MARGLGRLFGRNAADNLNGPPPFMTPLIDDVVSHGVAPVRRLISTHRYGLKCHTFVNCRSFVRISEMNREVLDVISISAVPREREKCQQCAEVAYTPGTKRLYGVLASQWRHLAEGADWTNEIGLRPLMEKIRHARFLRKIEG
jgi:hypothetical protein